MERIKYKNSNMTQQYNNSMYPSLSEYVCAHAGQMTDITTLKKYAAACKKNEKVSYEYSGVYCSLRRHTQDYIGLIDDPMKEWFDANGLDYGKWFSETNANCQWMVRHLPRYIRLCLSSSSCGCG